MVDDLVFTTATAVMSEHKPSASRVAAADAKGVSSNALARKLVAVAAGTEVAFRVVLSAGTIIENGGASPAFIVTFRIRHAERRTIAFGYVDFRESHFAGGSTSAVRLRLLFALGSIVATTGCRTCSWRYAIAGMRGGSSTLRRGRRRRTRVITTVWARRSTDIVLIRLA